MRNAPGDPAPYSPIPFGASTRVATDLLNRARRSLWLGWLLDNPLLVREIRRRMRGRLFSWSLIAYILALGVVSILIMFASYPSEARAPSLRDQIVKIQEIGGKLYGGMTVLEVLIAVVVAPLLTAGLATVEKEKDTFDFLRVTTLNARTFVAGCLLTTACFLILVFSCTLPILGLTFIFGGKGLAEVLVFKTVVFLVAMAICALGILVSTNAKRSVSALGSIVVLMFLVLFISGSFLYGSVVAPIMAPLSGPGGVNRAAILGMACPLLVAFAASIAAARRLYEPNNRFFDYRQFAVLHLGLLGAGAAFVILDPTAARGLLPIHFLLGWMLSIFAVLNFTAGRVERGDEVWRLRMRFAALRRVPEEPFCVALCVAAWLAATGSLASLDSGPAPRFGDLFPDLALVGAVSVAVAWSFARTLSGYFEQRGRTMVAAILSLFVVWALVPGFGLLLDGMSDGAFAAPAELLKLFSPFTILGRVGSGDDVGGLVFHLAVQGLMGALAFVPSLGKVWRERTSVSYEWIVAPTTRG